MELWITGTEDTNAEFGSLAYRSAPGAVVSGDFEPPTFVSRFHSADNLAANVFMRMTDVGSQAAGMEGAIRAAAVGRSEHSRVSIAVTTPWAVLATV